VRIVLTDGERAADFAWLRHAGRQVACGVPEDASWHMTYPEDGRLHMTVKQHSGGRRVFVRKAPVPLAGFTGHRALLALGIGSTALAEGDLKPFKHTPQDAVAFLDLRAFGDAMVWTELGIVEPGQTHQLRFDFTVQQVLLVTSVSPWVYVAAGVNEGEILRR